MKYDTLFRSFVFTFNLPPYIKAAAGEAAAEQKAADAAAKVWRCRLTPG